MAYKFVDHWDPLKFKDDQPSPQFLLRLVHEIADFFAKPPAGLFISPEEDDVTKVHALVTRPAGTPYDDGFSQFFMKFSTDYPMSPPRVRIMTTDSGRVRFYPNLYANGKVCLSVLGTWPWPAWSPTQCMESALISIQSLLNENPYYNESLTLLWWFTSSDASDYNAYLQPEAISVAVCGTVKGSPDDSPQCPQTFRENVYEKYEGVAKKNRHLSGTATISAMHTGVFDSKKLLVTLKELNTIVKKNSTMELDKQTSESYRDIACHLKASANFLKPGVIYSHGLHASRYRQ